MQSKARALAVLALCALAKGHPQESEKLLKDAGAADADTATLALTRSLALLVKTNQLDKVRSTWSLCEQILPYIGSKEKRLGFLHLLEVEASKTNSLQQREQIRQQEQSLMANHKAAHVPSKAETLVSQAHLCFTEKKYTQAIALYSQAIVYFDSAKQEHLSRQATLDLCACLGGLGQIKEARVRLGELLSRCEKDPQPGFLIEALTDAAICDRQLGNYNLSLSEFVHALPIVEKSGNRSMLASLLFWDLADGYRTAGKIAAYEASTRRALAIYRELGDTQGISLAMETLATCLENQKRTTEAQSVLTELCSYRETKYGGKSLPTTQVFLHLGNLARGQKNTQLAVLYYTKVMDNLESMKPSEAKQGMALAAEIVTYCKSLNRADDLLSKRASTFLSKIAPSPVHTRTTQ